MIYISENTVNIIKTALILIGALVICFIDILIAELGKFLYKLSIKKKND